MVRSLWQTCLYDKQVLIKDLNILLRTVVILLAWKDFVSLYFAARDISHFCHGIIPFTINIPSLLLISVSQWETLYLIPEQYSLFNPEMYLFSLVAFNILALAAWAGGRALCSVTIDRSSHAGSTGLSWSCSPKNLINHSRLPIICLYPVICFAKHWQYLLAIYFCFLWVHYLNVQVSGKYKPAWLCSEFITGTTCHSMILFSILGVKWALIKAQSLHSSAFDCQSDNVVRLKVVFLKFPSPWLSC